LLRLVFRLVLESQQDMSVSARRAMDRALRQWPSTDPDVVLMDVRYARPDDRPDPQDRADHGRSRVLILTRSISTSTRSLDCSRRQRFL